MLSYMYDPSDQSSDAPSDHCLEIPQPPCKFLYDTQQQFAAAAFLGGQENVF